MRQVNQRKFGIVLTIALKIKEKMKNFEHFAFKAMSRVLVMKVSRVATWLIDYFRDAALEVIV